MSCVPRLRGLKMKTKVTKNSIIRRKSREPSLHLSDLKMSPIKRSEINQIRELLLDPTLKYIERFSLAVYLKSLIQDETIKLNKK